MYLLADFVYKPRVAITEEEAKQYNIPKKYYVDDDKAVDFITRKNNQSKLDKNKLDYMSDKLMSGVVKQKNSEKQIKAVQRAEKMTGRLRKEIEKNSNRAYRASLLLKNSRDLLR